VGIFLNRQMNTVKNPERFKHPDRGEYDQALKCEPDSKEVATLINSLSKLKNCR
jgi:hypothetical protein